VIDSGVTSWHDDLTNSSGGNYPYGNQRVTKFVDFVNGRSQPYDDNGHGSHVAGTILGNGRDSNGEKAGIAPRASLISLKVLDQNGQGTISNFIRALNWIAANAKAYNIRVVNVSIGAAIRESYWTDPLTVAAKAIADKGIAVVVAAGNFGQNADGQLQWGGITAPANAPWVITVGASSTLGTLTRADDEMACVQLVGSDVDRFPGQAGSRRAGRRHRIARRPRQRVLQLAVEFPVAGRPFARLHAVSRTDRHEHGGAGRGRHRRADARSESESDAESGQGDPAVHGGVVSRLQPVAAGRGVSEHARRGPPRAVLYRAAPDPS
jgi:subtilisin family serine protease